MENKEELNANTDWNEVLHLIYTKEFPKKYRDYNVYLRENGYSLKLKEKAYKKDNEKPNEKSDEIIEEQSKEKNIQNEINGNINEKEKAKIIFLFKQKEEINIYSNGKLFGTVNVFTSLEIETFVKAKNKDINHLFIKGEECAKYLDCIDFLGLALENNELALIEKKSLPDLKLDNPLPLKGDYTAKQYSSFFYDYFIYEDKNKENEKILYQENGIRSIIFDNIAFKLRAYKKIRKFKFTGPSSIGKSFTLLRLSHTCYNIAYINLKVLNDKEKTSSFETYSIIISELVRFNIENYLEKIKQIIIKNYNEDKSYLDVLLNLIEYLSEIEETFVFIFDQFKPKYVNKSFINKIYQFKNIKIVQCSSINDKDIREECIKSWALRGKNVMRLDENNQDYYLYFENMYDFKKNIDINIDSNIVIFRQFDYMPKYIKKYKDYSDKNKIYNDAKKHIAEKIDEFCKSYKLDKSLLYSNLRYIINKDYDYSKFEEVIKYCPLKYFIIKFATYHFNIKPIFPFMQNVIYYEYTEIECYNFFKKEMYKKDLITNNLIKGDYFEASAKFELRKLQLPKKRNYLDITLYEIISMDKIIDNKNEYYIEENKEIEDAITKENDSISNTILEQKEGNEIENIDSEKENNSGEEEEDELEDEEEEEIEDEEEDEKEENEENKWGKEFESLLKEFKINLEKNNSNENKFEGLSKEAKNYSKTIEDYRYDELNKQRKSEQKFNKSIYSGDESIFLDQYSKFGKTLDFAYLYGKKNEKVFIGFQIKCYFETSILKENFVEKSYIKRSCRKILINSMKLFNCKITKWNYFLIFYYNPNNINENISKSNINKCKLKGISYLFYDPIEKKFYRKKGTKTGCTTKLKINKISNLETNVITVDEFAYEIPENRKLEIGDNIMEMKKSFINDLSKALKIQGQNNSISTILSTIASNIGIRDYSLFFYAKLKFNKSLICPKKDKYILLYKKKTDKTDDYIINFIACIKKRKKIQYFDLLSKKELKKIYEAIDEDSEYYYCLCMNKSRKN